jgi:hypothetical protein
MGRYKLAKGEEVCDVWEGENRLLDELDYMGMFGYDFKFKNDEIPKNVKPKRFIRKAYLRF